MYDSRPDTLEHIAHVQDLLEEPIGNLRYRSGTHDRSKLEEPELSMYDEFVPKLRTLTYGSPEYKACLVDMGEALAHHYANNAHHPEHFEAGIRGMSLMALIEMLADWKASTLRVKDGDLASSIEKNQDRFGFTDETRDILVATARELGWLPEEG
jgi:Family of unknown function (DUF5662)